MSHLGAEDAMNSNRQVAACVFDLILLLQFQIKCKRLPFALKTLEGETNMSLESEGNATGVLRSRIAETPKYVRE